MTPFNPDIFKMGYIILYRNDKSFFGNSIRAKQVSAGFSLDDADYVHCEISGGGEWSVNISPPISKLVKITEAHKGRYVKLMRFKNADYEAGKRYKVAYFSAALCNKSYDIKGILSFLFKWIKQDNRLYFCSEGAAYSLRMCFPVALGPKENSEIMPASFLGEEFENMWEGIIPI